jgi:hypothetical protein
VARTSLSGIDRQWRMFWYRWAGKQSAIRAEEGTTTEGT